MSRAASYRTAAADLRRASVRFTEVAVAHRRKDATVVGAVGPVASVHDRSVEAVGRHLTTAAHQAAHLAIECERRAEVCDEYDRQVASWSTLPWDERLVAPPPVPPARWVAG